jgi:hypothetical protein
MPPMHLEHTRRCAQWLLDIENGTINDGAREEVDLTASINKPREEGQRGGGTEDRMLSGCRIGKTTPL